MAFSISWTCFVTDEGPSRSGRAAEEKLSVSTTAAKHLSERLLASFRMLFGRAAAMALLILPHLEIIFSVYSGYSSVSIYAMSTMKGAGTLWRLRLARIGQPNMADDPARMAL